MVTVEIVLLNFNLKPNKQQLFFFCITLKWKLLFLFLTLNEFIGLFLLQHSLALMLGAQIPDTFLEM